MTGLNDIKQFTDVIYECSLYAGVFFPAGLSSLVSWLCIRPGAYPRVEHLGQSYKTLLQ
jgi:hypothetical protein